MRIWLTSIALLFGALGATTAFAHPMAPSLLQLEELDAKRIRVMWKTPMQGVPGTTFEPVFPENCVPTTMPVVRDDGPAWIHEWEMSCGSQGLVGAEIRMDGISRSRANVLLRIRLADEREVRAVLKADDETFLVPAKESRVEVFKSYIVLGVEHILTGFDHLVFLFGLMLLVPIGRRLVWTVTSFTLGHSVTLCLAVLGWVRFPSAWIEVAIAATIVVVGVEAVGRVRGLGTRWDRLPIALGFGFGLLHGLGFAGALAEVGLPGHLIPLSLLSFNLGIEVGQLFFIGVFLALWEVARRLPVSGLPRGWRYVPAYAVGTLGCFWAFQRLLSFAA